MEIWGHCGSCGCWFYCSSGAEGDAWSCPACDREPVAIENRRQPDHAAFLQVDRAAVGL